MTRTELYRLIELIKYKLQWKHLVGRQTKERYIHYIYTQTALQVLNKYEWYLTECKCNCSWILTWMLTENNKCRYTLIRTNTNNYVWALGSRIINYKLLNLNQRKRDANSRWSLIIQDKEKWNLTFRYDKPYSCRVLCWFSLQM